MIYATTNGNTRSIAEAIAGARMAAPPESFMVSTKPALEPGEIERAAAWAAAVADAVAARVAVG